MNASVIVEPDSASAWIGLAGVALGALLSTGATWMQRRFTGLKEEHTELREALVEMLAGAESLAVTVRAFNSSRGTAESMLDWVPLMTLQTERVQKAALTIGTSRYATAELAVSAGKLSGAAILCARLNGADDSLDELTRAAKNFRPEVAKVETTLSRLRDNTRS